MSRLKSRTVYLSPDTIRQLQLLFGTVINVHRRLGLQLDVPYNTFYRAMNFQPITPHHRDCIERRWARWRELYLPAGCPKDADLALHTIDLNLEPEWKTHHHPPSRSRRASS